MPPESLLPLQQATFHILLAVADEDRHGYGIIGDIEQRTGGQLRLSAGTLYRSMRTILETLPKEMRLFMCHDYGPNGRDIRWETSIHDERTHNIHIRDGISEEEFVVMREARDKTLGMPKLIVP